MRRRFIKIGIAVFLVGVAVMLTSCVSFSPFMIREAALPAGWPERTPVGEIRIQTYPAYRAATVTAEQAGGGMDKMHGALFGHIKNKGISMTAPVDMSYPAEDVAAGPVSMAFMYRSTQQGAVGADGRVLVADVQPATFVSMGVRGGYRSDHIAAQVTKLTAWLEQQDDWRPAGPPRYLGYNSPFVPAFMRYGEVQIPVQTADTPSAPTTRAVPGHRARNASDW